jgi:RNA polymerase sigma-70 factor (ECF subfamily)
MSDSASPSDTRPSLLVRLRDARDQDAWQTFVAVYAPLVYRHCRRRGMQDADAADVAQDVLTEVARSLRTFEYRPERGRFRDWLGTLTRHQIGRFLTRKERAPAGNPAPLPEDATAPAADPEWVEDFNAQVLRAALDRTRPHFEAVTWQAFEMVWLHQRPAAETADALGVALDKVYVAKSRVLKRLQEEVLDLAEDLPQFVPLG